MINEEVDRRQESIQEDWDAFQDDGQTEIESEDEGLLPRYEQNLPISTQDETPTLQSLAIPYLLWIGHIFQQFAAFGPSVFSWDAWKSCILDIITHAGFFTYVHHDAAGFATYAFIRKGCKIWGIHRPKVTLAENTRHKIFELMRRILRPHMMLDYIQHTDLYNIFLLKGDVL
jgi:Zn-dependent protease with chaperone function